MSKLFKSVSKYLVLIKNRCFLLVVLPLLQLSVFLYQSLPHAFAEPSVPGSALLFKPGQITCTFVSCTVCRETEILECLQGVINVIVQVKKCYFWRSICERTSSVASAYLLLSFTWKSFAFQSVKKMDLANHGLILLQQLNAQREFGFLCDCTVAIGDVYFKAHKSVLASFSNYFKMLFVHQTR